MSENRLIAAWLRPVVALIGLAAVLTLGACGGGSGAPNNPYAPVPATPTPIVVLPGNATVYSGVPTTLTVSGGTPPYAAFTSNSAILPVTQTVKGYTVVLVAGSVDADTNITISIQDAGAQTTTVPVIVKPAPLLPTLVTVLPNTDCAGSNNLCSGGNGTAQVKVTGPGGGGVSGRQVRFDVVQGTWAIQTTNPAQPLASTLTVVSDINGDAKVVLAVPANTPTQVGIIRATEVQTGNFVTGNFTIQQITDGSAILSVIPNGTTTINGPLTTQCSTGARVSYYIYGGTPPYNVSATFPAAVSLSGVPVTFSGGHFDAITNGTCFTAMQFAISDATGRVIPGANSPLLTNALGTVAPTPAPTLTVNPGSVTNSACTGKTFNFVITGGLAPYNVTASPSGPVITPTPVAKSGDTVAISGLLTGSGVTAITIADASNPIKTTTINITCS